MTLQKSNLSDIQVCSQSNIYSYNNCKGIKDSQNNQQSCQTLQINDLQLGVDATLFKSNLSKETSEFYNLGRPMKRFEIKKDLLNNNYDPIKYKLRFDQNTNFVKDIFEIYKFIIHYQQSIQ